VETFDLTFHWHYTPKGCSLSAHYDAEWKLGSRIFYLNTEDDWDECWGGQILILDDGGRFNHRSAPTIDKFARVIPSKAVGNSSLMFQRTDRSWQGIYPLAQPEGVLRKMFIVEVRKVNLTTACAHFLTEPETLARATQLATASTTMPETTRNKAVIVTGAGRSGTNMLTAVSEPSGSISATT